MTTFLAQKTKEIKQVLKKGVRSLQIEKTRKYCTKLYHCESCNFRTKTGLKKLQIVIVFMNLAKRHQTQVPL